VTDPATVEGAVVFTDIVGFTAFTAEQGDEQAVAVLSAQDRIVQEHLPEGARLVKQLGDGLMLWFPTAAGAVVTCVALQRAFRHQGAGGMPSLWVRMGLHWGEQTAWEDDLVGHVVNVAARIVDLAAPQEILVSEAVLQAQGGPDDGIRFDPVGPALMKGVPDPVWLYRVDAGGA
jgi:adenylate cyclase